MTEAATALFVDASDAASRAGLDEIPLPSVIPGAPFHSQLSAAATFNSYHLMKINILHYSEGPCKI